MKWRCILAVLIGLSITDVATFAEKPPEAERLPPSPSSLERGVYFGDTHSDKFHGMARFQLIRGRLRLHPSIHRKGRESRDEGNVHESISVRASDGVPSLQYAYHSDAFQLSLSVERGDSVRLELIDVHQQKRHVLEQFAGVAVRWRIQSGNQSETREAESLLHLRRRSPEDFDQTFGSIMTSLLRGCSLDRFAHESESMLIKSVLQPDDHAVSRHDILAMVDQLGHPSRSIRENATRRLLSVGTPVVSVVLSVDKNDLDAEQTMRIGMIVHRLRRQESETAAAWAASLTYDRAYLTEFADTLPLQQQELISAHLGRNGLAPLESVSDTTIRVARLNK